VQFVPVLSSTGQRLMPCHAARARELVRKGKAVSRFDRGLFYIRLLERESGNTQPIAVGIDPGSKKEALTIKSEAHTLLNIQADAVTWVKDAEETSTQMRRARRSRKCPYRERRSNRNINTKKLPPSTRSRWGWKLRLCRWLARYYPITVFAVEDIAAVTKKGRRLWNQSFSPLEIGKQWFYRELGEIAPVKTRRGYETKALRDTLGLKKSRQKMSDKFEAHCVDSWVLANEQVGGYPSLDNKFVLYIVPLHFHRRQLQVFQPDKGGVRKLYGGTRSLGFKRGSWVNHSKYGVCYVGGSSRERISLHAMQDGKRLCRNAKPVDLRVLCTASWRVRKGEYHEIGLY
jgi:hypothetical protein